GRGVDIDKSWRGARRADGGDSRHGRVRHSDHFVAWADAKRFQGEEDGIRAAVDADTEIEAAVAGEFRLEPCDVRAQDQPSRAEDSVDGCQDLVPLRLVLSTVVPEVDVFHGATAAVRSPSAVLASARRSDVSCFQSCRSIRSITSLMKRANESALGPSIRSDSWPRCTVRRLL